MLPRDNVLPHSTYEAKKIVFPLGLEVQKIHACINDCILYRGEEYENLNACPVCGSCCVSVLGFVDCFSLDKVILLLFYCFVDC